MRRYNKQEVNMWKIKTFKTRDAMQKFLARNDGKIQWVEVFVNNAFAIEWRKLRRVY